MTSSTDVTTSRLHRLRSALDEHELDAVLISNEHNRRYLSGFRGSAGYLLISKDEAILTTDFRYTEQAGLQAPKFEVLRVRGSLAWFPETAHRMGVKRVGFESDDLTVWFHGRLEGSCAEFSKERSDAPELQLVPTTGITQRLRAVKDAEELDLLTRAIEIGDRAFEHVLQLVRPGMTEAQVAWEIEKSAREGGAESLSFDTIVASGPNGARPHHLAGDRVLREGEPIVIDMGCKYEGYCSDLTRTIVLGEPDEQLKKVYDTVLAAQQTAIETVTSGMTGEAADGLARNVIDEAGYAEHFGHSLGHGVGLEVHEDPGVGPNSKNELQDGMVFTIEPGIYLSGWGGVRIEDVVVLDGGRAKMLSTAKKPSP